MPVARQTPGAKCQTLGQNVYASASVKHFQAIFGYEWLTTCSIILNLGATILLMLKKDFQTEFFFRAYPVYTGGRTYCLFGSNSTFNNFPSPTHTLLLPALAGVRIVCLDLTLSSITLRVLHYHTLTLLLTPPIVAWLPATPSILTPGNIVIFPVTDSPSVDNFPSKGSDNDTSYPGKGMDTMTRKFTGNGQSWRS